MNALCQGVPRANAPAARNPKGRRLEPAQAQRFTAQRETHDMKLRQEAIELHPLGFAGACQFPRRNEDRLRGVTEGRVHDLTPTTHDR